MPVDDENIVSFSLSYDDTTDRLYSLGFETRNNRQKTVLKSHSGPVYEKSEIIFASGGEDSNASFVLDRQQSKLYTTLGYGAVSIIGYDGLKTFGDQNQIPERLMSSGDFLFSLNRDSSISVWDKKSGLFIMELYIFEDYSFLCVLSDSNYFTSGRAERYLIRN